MSNSGAGAESLSQALEREHREIDGSIKECADGSTLDPLAKEGLRQAVEELRRHIYVEEELLFPPLREAGMVGPIMVMLREHAQMWPILDTLDLGLDGGVSDDVLRTACSQLYILLQHHNPKEEQILYPQVDRVVGDGASTHARGFLDAGRVPEGWTCQHLRAQHGRA